MSYITLDEFDHWLKRSEKARALPASPAPAIRGHLGIKPSRTACIDKSVEFVFARLAVFARKKVFYGHLRSSGPGEWPFQTVRVMM